MTRPFVQAPALLVALMALTCVPMPQAHAGDVFRCIGHEGRIEYRDWPCANQDGARLEVKPNVATEIDQSAARAANAAIAERTARRMAQQDASRAMPRAQPAAAPANDALEPWWWVGGGVAERPRGHRRDLRDRHRPRPVPHVVLERSVGPARGP